MPRIPCTGRDGVTREFEYQYEFDELDKVWHFAVEAVPRPDSMEIFTMTFKPINETTIRQISITHHHDPAYAAMGIPDAMLPEVKRILGKEVESSPPDVGGEFRSVDAEKMWTRLVGKGLAEYVCARKVYRVL